MRYPPRTYTAKRLLEHGALTAHEFIEITGWPANVACAILRLLCQSGLVCRDHAAGTHRYIYRLVAA